MQINRYLVSYHNFQLKPARIQKRNQNYTFSMFYDHEMNRHQFSTSSKNNFVSDRAAGEGYIFGRFLRFRIGFGLS